VKIFLSFLEASEDRGGWLAFLNTVRTELFEEVLALRAMLPPFASAA